ncbi:Na+/H+ antiporter NhaA [Phenylobacterium sp.]|jgi:NhaA family Na+:H+ antiporter|uniref:Na+/H+ antiporter NhaA n=1 Tax=Phenylobacterium sp. TaxID=1871053 RepID=UPI002E303BAC|nr:Na+/H+ antiporter NhaA [Phenylobacterium sp.]HEX2560769.1 Na+/H+ antiporter NhaA [Phenylobacterium sp.]
MEQAVKRRRRPSALRAFLGGEAAGGIVLIIAAALGLALANSPLADSYFGALKAYVGPLSLLHWINDALMAVFFLLVGLEVKRELLDGQLSRWSRRVLPGLAAVGGMVAPALIYMAFNRGVPEAQAGWAIPTATDIAFTLGVLALLGRRVPVSLKIFVTALAIIDDLGAVLIIALFYSANLSVAWLGAAGGVLAVLIVLNRLGVRTLWPYLALGAVLWFCVLQSGVHATIAGVALALTIPLTRSPARPDDGRSPLHRLEHALHRPVGFVIVPIFGFANAGVSLAGLSGEALLSPITLGVALGLFLGKQIGVFLFTWLAVRLRLADRPEDATWGQVWGVSILCGIGFTMSLFIGLLAFANQPLFEAEVKIGVLAGSLLSAALGAIVLVVARKEPAPTPSRRPGKARGGA